ncbi:hypothetical protein [Nostoc sp. UHCC 0302]
MLDSSCVLGANFRLIAAKKIYYATVIKALIADAIARLNTLAYVI